MRFRALLTLGGLLGVGVLMYGWVGMYHWFSSERVVFARSVLTRFSLPQVALILAPEDPSLAYQVGNFYLGEKAHDLQKAEKYFKQAGWLGYPSPAYIYFGLSRVYFFEGRYNKAIEAINETLRLDSSIPNSYYMRGLIYGYKGSLQESERDFARFLKLKPESWAGANDLAWIYFRQGKFEEVKNVVKNALGYNPDNPWLLNSLGVAFLNLGDKEGAKDAFEKSLSGFKAMTPVEWGKAYPGNDARYHAQGLSSTISAIEKNIRTLSYGGAEMVQ